MLRVVVGEACPSWRLTKTTLAPWAISRLAKVWLRSWKRRVGLVGVHAQAGSLSGLLEHQHVGDRRPEQAGCGQLRNHRRDRVRADLVDPGRAEASKQVCVQGVAVPAQRHGPERKRRKGTYDLTVTNPDGGPRVRTRNHEHPYRLRQLTAASNFTWPAGQPTIRGSRARTSAGRRRSLSRRLLPASAYRPLQLCLPRSSPAVSTRHPGSEENILPARCGNFGIRVQCDARPFWHKRC